MAKNESTSLIRDLNQGSVLQQLLIFAFPLMCSNLLQTLYNMVDMVVIGHFVGKEGLSAVTIGGEVLHCLTFIVMGFSSAGQVLISQYIGAGRRDKIKGIVGTMFTLILSSALIFSVICLFALNSILQWVNTPAEALEYAREYCITCIIGLIFIYGYNLVSGILRGMGDSKRPLLFIAVASTTNLILDLIFVAVFQMGPMGAALATVIGQGVSFAWAIVYLYRHRQGFGFDFKPASFRIDREILPALIKLGLPMCLQSAAINLSMIIVSSFINSYGVVACSVTGIGNKLCQITSVVTNALVTGGSSMIGQSIGAGKYQRVSKIMRISMIVGCTFAVLLMLVTCLFPRAIFGIFNSEPEVLDMAMSYVPVSVLLYLGFGLRSPFFALINGSGNSKLNLMVGLLDGVVFRIGLSVLMGVTMGMGIMGFWLGNALAGYVPFVFGCIFYFSGSWKKQRLVI